MGQNAGYDVLSSPINTGHERQLKVFRTKIDVKNRSMGHFAG